MAVRCLTCAKPLPVPPGVDEFEILDVAERAGAGIKIDAIRRLRELTAWGLKEAREYVECPHVLPAAPVDRRVAIPACVAVPCPACGATFPSLPDRTLPDLREIARLIGERSLIQAIKLLRDASGLGLKEARDYIDCPHRSS